MKRSILAISAVVLLCCVPLVQAEVPGGTPDPELQLAGGVAGPAPSSDEPEWGTSVAIAYVVPGFSFNNLQDSLHARTTGSYIFKSAGLGIYDQTIHLPSGAMIDSVTTFYYDTDTSANVQLYLYRETITAGVPGSNADELLHDTSTGSAGYQTGRHPLVAPELVRNYDPVTSVANHYLLVVQLAPSGTSTNLRFGGVIVWYRQTLSPAPATATFSDVPTNYWAFRHIEALAASGITAGCGTGIFCPEQYVKRSEMAVYLAKALGLHWADSLNLAGPAR